MERQEKQLLTQLVEDLNDLELESITAGIDLQRTSRYSAYVRSYLEQSNALEQAQAASKYAKIGGILGGGALAVGIASGITEAIHD